MLFLKLQLLISAVIANRLVVAPYYHNISPDEMTLAVGDVMLLFDIIFVCILSCISTMINAIK